MIALLLLSLFSLSTSYIFHRVVCWTQGGVVLGKFLWLQSSSGLVFLVSIALSGERYGRRRLLSLI